MLRTILTVVGARPQFVKAAAVSRILRAQAGVREILLHTGQHYDGNMSAVFFEELSIPDPDIHLGIGSGFHGAQTAGMLEGIERALLQDRPTWLLVYGDTNSTLAGALAGAKLGVPVAHVEAGLRSFNPAMAEEINRVVADHVSRRLFAPTNAAVANLQREGIPAERVTLSGDVMYDAAIRYGAQAERKSRILRTLGVAPRSYALATVHRAENTDDPGRLDTILSGLQRVAESIPVVLPLHPRTRKALRKPYEPVTLIDPVGYLDMVQLEKNARIVATDSGGVQKEAFFHRIPCVTLRSETEWTELVRAGWNVLAPLDSAESVCRTILDNLDRAGESIQPYGDGHAAERIVGLLLETDPERLRPGP